MKFPLILLAVLQMHGITEIKEQALIESTCKYTPNYQLCVSTLHASPESANADVAGLGLIMVDAIKSETEAAIAAVDRLTQLHPELRSALEDCRRSYMAVLKADVPEAVEALTKGVPKFAESGMVDAAWETEICEAYFGTAAESPLSRVNTDLHDLAEIAVSIARMLL